MSIIKFDKLSDKEWAVLSGKRERQIGEINKVDDEYRTFHTAIDGPVECFDTLEEAKQDITENW